jgi:hypothetical protein
VFVLLAFLLARTLPEPGPEAVVLGIAQDGGVPHAGCHHALCVEARRDPVPVYCTPSMARFLRENRPWSRLVALENIVIREIEPERELTLTPNLRVTAIRVPHRDEEAVGRGRSLRERRPRVSATRAPSRVQGAERSFTALKGPAPGQTKR